MIHLIVRIGSAPIQSIKQSICIGTIKNNVLINDRFLLFSFTAKTPAEEAYNKAHSATFSVMARALARWKRRFPSLETGLDIRSEILDSVIIATAVLHNIAVRRGEPEPPASGAPSLKQPPPSEQIPATYRGDQARKQIIQSGTLGGTK